MRPTTLVLGIVGGLTLSTIASAQWIGPDVIARPQLDLAYQITFLDPGHVSPINGFITKWHLWANDTGAVNLQMWRPTATGFTLIGQNAVSVGTLGDVTLEVAPVDRIQVQTGDVVGFRYQGNSQNRKVIAFTFGGGTEQWTTWPLPSGDVPVGGSLAHGMFTGQGEARAYSINAMVEAVPEPATMAALGVGLVALARRRNRR